MGLDSVVEVEHPCRDGIVSIMRIIARDDSMDLRVPALRVGYRSACLDNYNRVEKRVRRATYLMQS